VQEGFALTNTDCFLNAQENADILLFGRVTGWIGKKMNEE